MTVLLVNRDGTMQQSVVEDGSPTPSHVRGFEDGPRKLYAFKRMDGDVAIYLEQDSMLRSRAEQGGRAAYSRVHDPQEFPKRERRNLIREKLDELTRAERHRARDLEEVMLGQIEALRQQGPHPTQQETDAYCNRVDTCVLCGGPTTLAERRRPFPPGSCAACGK